MGRRVSASETEIVRGTGFDLPMNDVPYLRKYHHSKMSMSPEMRLEVPVRAT